MNRRSAFPLVLLLTLGVAGFLALGPFGPFGPFGGERAGDGDAVARAAGPEDVDRASEPVLRGSEDATSEELIDTAWLEVRVREAPDGAMLAHTDVHVLVLKANDDRMLYRNLTRTDGEGRLRIGPFPTRDIVVVVASRDRLPSPKLRPVAREDDVAALDVALELGLTVSGRVVLPHGVPPEAVQVALGEEWLRWGEGRTPASDGTFTFGGLPDRKLALIAVATHAGKAYIAKADVKAGDCGVELVVAAARRGDLAMGRIRVIDETGEDVGASVSIRHDAGHYVSSGDSILVREEGIFFYEYRPRLGHTFHVQPGADSGFGDAVVQASAGEDTTVVLRPALTLRGLLFDEAGWAIEDARALVRPVWSASNDVLRCPPHAAAVTSGGSFEIPGLGHGRYLLEFVVPATHVMPPPRIVSAGRDDVVVRVQRALAVRIAVTDETDQPIVGAVVRVWRLERKGASVPDHAWIPVRWETDQRGEVVVKGLGAEAFYRLTIEPPSDRSDLVPVRRDDWVPKDETCRLAQALSIEGTMRDAAGDPVAGMSIRCRAVGGPGAPATGASRNAASDAAGRFRIERVPAGRYRLIPDRDEDRSVVVDAGATDVVLTTPAVVDLRIRLAGIRPSDRGAPVMLRTDRGLRQSHLDENGCVTFTKEQRGRTCELWVGGLEGGRYAWGKDLEPVADVVVVPVVTGGQARGRLIIPEGVTLDECEMAVVGPLLGYDEREGLLGTIPGEVDLREGTFVCRGLPPGTWDVLAEAGAGETSYHGEAEISQDAEIRVKLEETE